MENDSNLDYPVKFRPDYKWPEPGTQRKCPKCDHDLELQKNVPEYYGKPWWCPACQWQFSEEDLEKLS
jgi:transposase